MKGGNIIKINNQAIIRMLGILAIGVFTIVTKTYVYLWTLLFISGILDMMTNDSNSTKCGKNDAPTTTKPQLSPPSQKVGK